LSRANNLINLVIEDDGRGFDLDLVRNSYDERGSFGLINIEERARMVNGMAELRSTPGKGTTIRVSVPLD
jgi:signal transduction histidine kinase